MFKHFSRQGLLEEHYLRRCAQAVAPQDTYCWLTVYEDGLHMGSRGSNIIMLIEDHQEPPWVSTSVGMSIAEKMSEHLPIGDIREICFKCGKDGFVFARLVNRDVVLSVGTYADDVDWEQVPEIMEIYALELAEFIEVAGWFKENKTPA